MITVLKKKQKTTEIYFNEADDITTISTITRNSKIDRNSFLPNAPNFANSFPMMSSVAWCLKSTKRVSHLDA